MESRGVSVLGLLVGVVGVAFFSGEALAAQCGKAAWYDLDGQTANGEQASGSTMTAAHRTLPFGTKVRVENLSNGKSVVVRVNDRGPFVGGRVIDVTRAAAEELDMVRAGIAKVRVSVVEGKAKLDAGCADPSPRIITAETVASDPPKAKARQTAAKADTEAGTATASATPSPNESKPLETSGRTLVATVQYDEGSGAPAPSRPAAASAASFSEDAQLDDLEDGRITVADVDVPLPRPRPPIFGDSPSTSGERPAPVFNRTLALRFIDAFAPPEPGMRLDVRALGYAPMPEPRGAVITE